MAKDAKGKIGWFFRGRVQRVDQNGGLKKEATAEDKHQFGWPV
jgi:hypothetical protein